MTTYFAQAATVIRFSELTSLISLTRVETGTWKWRDSRPVIWRLVQDIAFLSVWGLSPFIWFWPAIQVAVVSAAGSHLVRLDVVVVVVFNYSKPCHVSV